MQEPAPEYSRRNDPALPDDFLGGTSIDGVAISRNGKRCAVVLKNNNLLIFDRPQSGEIEIDNRAFSRQNYSVLPDDFVGGTSTDSVAISRDGKRCAVVLKDDTLLIFDRPQSGEIEIDGRAVPIQSDRSAGRDASIFADISAGRLPSLPDFDLKAVIPESLIIHDAGLISRILATDSDLRKQLVRSHDSFSFKLAELLGPESALSGAISAAAAARTHAALGHPEELASMLSLLEDLQKAKDKMGDSQSSGASAAIPSLLLKHSEESLQEASLIIARNMSKKARLAELIDFVGLIDCLLIGQDLRSQMNQTAAPIVEVLDLHKNFSERTVEFLRSQADAGMLTESLDRPSGAAAARAKLIKSEYGSAEEYLRLFEISGDDIAESVRSVSQIFARGGVFAKELARILNSQEVQAKLAADGKLLKELANLQAKEIFGS